MIRAPGKTFGRIAYGLIGLLLVAHAAHALGVAKPALDDVFEPWGYHVLMWFAAISCTLRAVTIRKERAAWASFAGFLVCWTIGDVLWDFHFDKLEDPPWPNVADGFYLSSYLFGYIGLLSLLRARVRPWRLSMWLDGLIAGLAVASLGAAVVFPSILSATEGDAFAVAVTLAYPLLDCLALAFVVLAFGLCSWRPGRAWLLLGAGFASLAVADASYNYLTALGTYESGGITSVLWPLGTILCSLGAWQREGTLPVARGGLVSASVATGSAIVALGVLVAELLGRDSAFGGILALTAIALLVVRCLLTLRENDRILACSDRAALTDQLTGLPNRRRLLQDLGSACASDEQVTLGFFDLDGFKSYNDTFGHNAGDALLARLGGRLEVAVGRAGRAYRVGGDEFCVVTGGATKRGDATPAAAAAALAERGEGFAVTASFGLVNLPKEASTPEAAMGLADERMYTDKRGGRASGPAQITAVLLAALRERGQAEGSAEHHDEVAALAQRVARRLELPVEKVDEIVRAAALHDIGKVAVPDAILSKPGPLTEDEWAFIRQHTIIGERILASAPPLRPVAAIVRASHERFDGTGYPDGLSGNRIPLAARVVAVCDAFNAMIEDRAYRSGSSAEQALAELERCAGTQFDPAVVQAFADVFPAGRSSARPRKDLDPGIPAL